MVFFSTVASVLRCGGGVNKDFLLWTAHVGHAAVAYFHVVILKDGAEIVVWWEVLLDDVEENLATLVFKFFSVWVLS